MGSAHRTISGNFDGQRSVTPTPHSHNWGWEHTEASDPRPSERCGGFTSYPWEGLYLDSEECGVRACIEDPQPSPQLGQFLTDMMYGE
jgi:hypothetical protein